VDVGRRLVNQKNPASLTLDDTADRHFNRAGMVIDFDGAIHRGRFGVGASRLVTLAAMAALTALTAGSHG